MTHKQAQRIYKTAIDLDVKTKPFGRQNGLVTRNGLIILQRVLWRYLMDDSSAPTGFTSIKEIADEAIMSERSARTGFKALQQAGVIVGGQVQLPPWMPVKV